MRNCIRVRYANGNVVVVKVEDLSEIFPTPTIDRIARALLGYETGFECSLEIRHKDGKRETITVGLVMPEMTPSTRSTRSTVRRAISP